MGIDPHSGWFMWENPIVRNGWCGGTPMKIRTPPECCKEQMIEICVFSPWDSLNSICYMGFTKLTKLLCSIAFCRCFTVFLTFNEYPQSLPLNIKGACFIATLTMFWTCPNSSPPIFRRPRAAGRLVCIIANGPWDPIHKARLVIFGRDFWGSDH